MTEPAVTEAATTVAAATTAAVEALQSELPASLNSAVQWVSSLVPDETMDRFGGMMWTSADRLWDGRAWLNGSFTDAHLMAVTLGVIGLVAVLGLIAVIIYYFVTDSIERRNDRLLPAALSAAVGDLGVDEFGVAPGNGFGVDQSAAADSRILSVLYTLEEAFNRIGVYEFECRDMIVCEAHRADAVSKYGNLVPIIRETIGSIDDTTQASADHRVVSTFKRYRQAAGRAVMSAVPASARSSDEEVLEESVCGSPTPTCDHNLLQDAAWNARNRF